MVRALLAYKRGQPRVCAMVKAPTPEEEIICRRLCRERKVLIAERIRHVNRVKGLLFSQGISGDARAAPHRRERLVTLQTGDGRLLPDHLKAQVRRELHRRDLLLEQIKAVEAERDVLLAAQQAPAAMLLDIKGIGPEFAAILLVGRALPTLRQSTPGRFLCGPGANTLAERIGRSRTGRV